MFIFYHVLNSKQVDVDVLPSRNQALCNVSKLIHKEHIQINYAILKLAFIVVI